MAEIILNVDVREGVGTGGARAARRAGMVPGILYGGDKAPQSISLLAKDLAKMLENEASFSHVLTLNVDGQNESVLIKALQRHPAKSFVLHADFVRVVEGHKLTATVPLHFINQETSVGVKQQGGEILHNINEVEVSCLPQDLPEFIEVDMAKVEVGQVLHMTDLTLPKGVQLVSLAHGSDLPVANVHAPRVSKEDTPKEEGAAE